MTEDIIRSRITELRVKKDVSEYQMSLELGQNKGYLQAISSGRAMPSMSQFIKICEYFEITPIEFFDADISSPTLLRKATDGMKKLSDDDMLLLIGLINRLRKND
jgi:transcriptional regulator with XRE-family HTH domain